MRAFSLLETGWDSDHGSLMLQASAGSLVVGTVLAVLSAVANGSFTIFSKTGSVRRARVDPLVFNLWSCVGIVISSFLVLIFNKFHFTLWGLISGLLFVIFAANSYRAVRLIGVSVGTGIWSGVAVLVSFVAGLLFDPTVAVRSKLWALVAVIVILIGILGMAYAGHVGRVSAGYEESLESLLQREPSPGDASGTFPTGVFTAAFAGLAAGLILIPLTQEPDRRQGLVYLPSFAIGVVIFAPIVTAFPYVTSAEKQWPNFAPTSAALPGIVSGIVWNIGNALSIYAISYMGYSIAYPIMQCGILVAGLWGMFLFDEIAGGAATTFWVSGLVILVGVFLLAFSRADQ